MADVDDFPAPPVPLDWPEDAVRKEYTGGCHCGKFRYKFVHPVFDNGECKVVSCNCSICVAGGKLHIYMAKDNLIFTKGSWEELSTYEFNKKIITHHFCGTCAVPLISSINGFMALNVRAVDGVDVDKLQIVKYDGASLL